MIKEKKHTEIEKKQFCGKLNEMATIIHSDNRKMGFWAEKRQIGTLLMLVTSELAEALEADRKNRYFDPTHKEQPTGEDFDQWLKTHVKDTFEDELADTMIRLLDLCGAMDIDLEWHIHQKLKYNRARGFKHDKGY